MYSFHACNLVICLILCTSSNADLSSPRARLTYNFQLQFSITNFYYKPTLQISTINRYCKPLLQVSTASLYHKSLLQAFTTNLYYKPQRKPSTMRADSSVLETGIPAIDISTGNDLAPQQLLDAAMKYGFVFIENNAAGIRPAEIERIFELSKQFFSLPKEVKQEFSLKSTAAEDNHGWINQGSESLDPARQKRPDYKEYDSWCEETARKANACRAFNMGNPMEGKFLQKMPEIFQVNEATIAGFQRTCHELCQRIFEHIAVALDLDRTWFSSRHEFGKKGSSSVFRLLFYPGVEAAEPGIDVRAGAHSDYGSITLLFQQRGQPGLEIQTQEGQWASVPAEPVSSGDHLPILINIGDLLEDWTGGLLKSTVHRVAFRSEIADRYSMAYFCDPLDDVELVPVPSKLVSDYVKKTGKTTRRDGKILTAKDHLHMKLAETLKPHTG